LETNSTLGVKTAFVGVGGRGSCLAASRQPFEAASLVRLRINVTLGGLSDWRLRFLPFAKIEIDSRPTLRGISYARRMNISQFAFDLASACACPAWLGLFIVVATLATRAGGRLRGGLAVSVTCKRGPWLASHY